MQEPSEKTKASFADLFGSVRMALHEWAQVEEALFDLFDALLRPPTDELSSLVFFSSPSFESKKVLTDRIATAVLGADDLKIWTNIASRLTIGGEFRGKIAHYGIEYRISNQVEVMGAILRGDEPTYEYEGPFLRRSPKNKIPINKNTKGKSNISKTDIKDILQNVKLFSQLREDLTELAVHVSIKFPRPQPIQAGLQPFEPHGLTTQAELHRSPKNKNLLTYPPKN